MSVDARFSRRQRSVGVRLSAVCWQGIGRHGFRVLVIMPVYLANFGLSVPAALRTVALITQMVSPHRLARRRSAGPSCGRRLPHMEDTGSDRVAPCARVHSSACAAGWRRGRRRLWRPCWVLSAPSTPQPRLGHADRSGCWPPQRLRGRQRNSDEGATAPHRLRARGGLAVMFR